MKATIKAVIREIESHGFAREVDMGGIRYVAKNDAGQVSITSGDDAKSDFETMNEQPAQVAIIAKDGVYAAFDFASLNVALPFAVAALNATIACVGE